MVPLGQIADRVLADGPQRISMGGCATSYFFQSKIPLLDALCLAECVNMTLLLLEKGLTVFLEQLVDGFFVGSCHSHIKSTLSLPDFPPARVHHQ